MRKMFFFTTLLILILSSCGSGHSYIGVDSQEHAEWERSADEISSELAGISSDIEFVQSSQDLIDIQNRIDEVKSMAEDLTYAIGNNFVEDEGDGDIFIKR